MKYSNQKVGSLCLKEEEVSTIHAAMSSMEQDDTLRG
jgi:hypothetical protein